MRLRWWWGRCRDAIFCVSTSATMTDKYKDKYRTETTRLKGWSYATTGYYFVTICEKNRSSVFGDICDDTVAFIPLEKVAIECWMEIPEHFPFVELDAFCIMPNHIHGIIVINTHDSVETQNVETQNVETQNIASLRNDGLCNKFGPQSKNLASIVRGFKIGVTKYARENDILFQWQPRYFDRVIRDEQELSAVRNYIRNNPLEWALDEY
jgi:putative transposase